MSENINRKTVTLNQTSHKVSDFYFPARTHLQSSSNYRIKEQRKKTEWPYRKIRDVIREMRNVFKNTGNDFPVRVQGRGWHDMRYIFQNVQLLESEPIVKHPSQRTYESRTEQLQHPYQSFTAIFTWKK